MVGPAPPAPGGGAPPAPPMPPIPPMSGMPGKGGRFNVGQIRNLQFVNKKIKKIFVALYSCHYPDLLALITT